MSLWWVLLRYKSFWSTVCFCVILANVVAPKERFFQLNFLFCLQMFVLQLMKNVCFWWVGYKNRKNAKDEFLHFGWSIPGKAWYFQTPRGFGAKTVSKTAPSITMNVTHRITGLSKITLDYEYTHTECLIYWVSLCWMLMLIVVMLSVIMFSVFVPNVVTLYVIMLNVVFAECYYAESNYAECNFLECNLHWLS